MATYEITLKNGDVQEVEADMVRQSADGWFIFYLSNEGKRGDEVHRAAEGVVASYGLKSARTRKGPSIG